MRSTPLLVLLATCYPAFAQTAAEAPPAAAAAAPSTEKLICRRETETGSLAKRRRVCTTVAQREAQARDNQRDVLRQQEMNRLPQ